MKKFSFSMRGILNARSAQKEACEHELGAARMRQKEEEEKLEYINGKIEATLHSSTTSLPTADYFAQREKYLSMLKNMRQQQTVKTEAAKAEVEVCLSKLRYADIELKKMEKLEEKEFTSWKHEQHRSEQKLSDEIGTTLSFYKSRVLN